MTNRYLTTLVAAMAFAAATAQQAPTLITTQPEGTVYHLSRSTVGFESFYGNAQAHSSHGDMQLMVEAADGAVYLRHPINSLYTTTWIKGYKAESDTIVFDLPQAIYSEEFNGVTSYGYLNKMVEQTSGSRTTYATDTQSQKLKYVWRDNTLRLADGMAMGLCLESGGWTGYGEIWSQATRIDDNTSQPSDAAQVYDGLMLYMDLADESQLYPVKYALDGDDVYLGDLTQNMKNHWIKGELKDGVATFPATSLVGIDTITNSYVYASAVDYATGHTIYGTEYDSVYVTRQPLAFDYDSATRTLFTRQTLGIHKSSAQDEDLRSTDIFDVYRYAQVNPWVQKPGQPMPPLFTGYMPWDGSYAGVEFKLSFYSNEGNYLDPSKLFYCFYIDDEMLTFTTDEYASLKGDLDYVPYSYYDQYDFYKLGENDRRLYFYKDPKQKVGIEALYIDEENGRQYTLSSGVTEYYINGENGVEQNLADAKSVVSVEYTDMAGRRVARPGKGIYLRTMTLSDGKRHTQKVAY